MDVEKEVRQMVRDGYSLVTGSFGELRRMRRVLRDSGTAIGGSRYYFAEDVIVLCSGGAETVVWRAKNYGTAELTG